MSKLTKYDDVIFGDAALIGALGTPVAWIAAGGGWLAGIALGVAVLFPAMFLVALLGEFFASPPGPLRVPLVWIPFAAVVYVAAAWVGAGSTVALALAAAAFVYGSGRSWVALRRMALAGIDPGSPAELAASEPDPAPAAVAAPVGAPELPPVPEDLPEELKALVAGAQQDFRHLCDALADPALAGAAGVDAAGMRGESELVLRDILRRAPLVARVRRIAGERPDDEPARRTSDEALAGLRRQAEALRAATSAALQVAATDGHDPALLHEHTDNLHLLRDVREEALRGD
jgi:hypothetical protein